MIVFHIKMSSFASIQLRIIISGIELGAVETF